MSSSSLLERYREHGLVGIMQANEMEMIQDHIFALDVIPLVIKRDDELAFDFLLDKLGGNYYKGVIKTSLECNTTKYLLKVIALTELMLLEEIDDKESYSLPETCLVLQAYLQILPFPKLKELCQGSAHLTKALSTLNEDV